MAWGREREGRGREGEKNPVNEPLSETGELTNVPCPIGAMPLHVQRAYYIVHALALAKLTCAVLYSTIVARKVAWHLSAKVQME